SLAQIRFPGAVGIVFDLPLGTRNSAVSVARNRPASPKMPPLSLASPNLFPADSPVADRDWFERRQRPDRCGFYRRYSFAIVIPAPPHLRALAARDGANTALTMPYRGARPPRGRLHHDPVDHRPHVGRRRTTLIPRLVEEFEVRPALALAGRHQEAVATDEIVILADHDVVVTLGADIFEPYGLLAAEEVAPVGLHDRPWTREGVVIGRNFAAQHCLVGLVEVHAFLDYRLIVFMQRNAAGIERTRPLKVTGLDLKRIECAVAIRIDPLANRVPKE